MLRQILANDIEASLPSVERSVYIATSGGIDSSALVIAALDKQIQPIITSFTLDTHESQDFLAAQHLAQTFNLEFLPIYIPTDKEFICDSVIQNMTEYGLKNKADVECMYPFLYMVERLAKIGARYLVSGLWADGHFCLSKKGMIHSRHSQQAFQRFRHDYFYGKAKQQQVILPIACAKYNMQFLAPYWAADVFKLYKNTSWEDVNKPRQKEAIRKEFPELDHLRLKNHINLQLGDSGIAETVGNAVRTKFRPTAKSPVSAYNFLWRQLNQGV